MRFRALGICVCLLAATVSSAQPITRESIKDDAIGWMRVYNFPAAPKPIVVDHRTYSVGQLSIANQLATWIQATYTPTGGLGDAVRFASEKLSPYNQYTASLPQSYGAYAKVYTELKYDAAKKMVPASNSNVTWSIGANVFVGETALDLSTAERHYFTMPPFTLQHPSGGELEKLSDVSGHPVLGKYPSWYQRNSVNGNRRFVFITRDYKLPYTRLTRGEYLDVMHAAVVRRYADEKKKLDAEHNRKYAEVALKNLEVEHARRLEVLQANREKYKTRLNEPAEIYTDQPSSLLNQPDVFDGTGGSKNRLPVYTIDPALTERAKTDQPQWIVVSWTAADGRDPILAHLQQTVLTRFNFQYLRDYFFDPDKVKGQAYTPLLAP